MKDLKDLNLLDRFLFAEAMEDPQNMRDVLEIILGKDVVLKHLPQTEKHTVCEYTKSAVPADTAVCFPEPGR